MLREYAQHSPPEPQPAGAAVLPLARSAFEAVCFALTALAAAAALFGSFVMLPYRMTAVEGVQKMQDAQIASLRTEAASDRLLLVQIAEDVKLIQKTLDSRENSHL